MEPVFRPSRRLFHELPTFITRSFRNIKASALLSEAETTDRWFRGTKDVPVLRINHVTLESVLPRVWKTGFQRVKRCDGIKL